jgi:hypothetical protein
MDLLHRIASGVIGMLLPGLWLAVAIHPVYAEDAASWLTSGQKLTPNVVQPSVPLPVQPRHPPPGSVIQSPPLSQRPFAQPFIDRSPSMADRPLAPIGGGTPGVPDSAPFVWCRGQWIRATALPSGCAWR